MIKRLLRSLASSRFQGVPVWHLVGEHLEHARSVQAFLGTFDAIRIINLPSRADRRKATEQEFQRFGITIDGNAIAFVDAQRPESAGGFETIGTRGCFLSHLDVLERSLAAGHERLLILEDDIAFTRNLYAQGKALAATLQDEAWGIFYGGHEQINTATLPPSGAASTVPPDMPVRTAHCLALTRPTIEKLVPYLRAMLSREPGSPEGGPMHVDGAYSWFRRAHPDIVTLAAPTIIADQRASRTDIHELPLSDKLPIVREAKEAMRRMTAVSG